MKLFGLFALFALVACGEIKEPKADNPAFEELVDSEPKMISRDEPKIFKRIMAVCAALRAKEDFLRDPSRNQQLMVMDLDHLDCNGSQFPGRDISVRINSRGGNYNFEYAGQSGIFTPIPSVESRNDGLLQEICDKGASMVTPMPISDSDASALIYTAFDNASGCVSDDKDSACIYVARGNYTEDKKQVRIFEWHYIEFRLTGDYRGFYNKRSQTKTCSNGAKTQTIQTFK